MTADGALAADPGSLAFDVAPLAAAARGIAASRDPLMSYVAAVRAIPMGEQPIIVDGREGARYDVLAKKPQLRTALYEAIRHANDLADSMTALHNWAAGGAAHYVGLIVPPLEIVRSILAAVPVGGAVSAADVPRIREQMLTVNAHALVVRMSLNQIGTGIRAFLSHIMVDHDTFAGGPLELRRMTDEIGRQISDDAMPLVLDLMSSGVGKAMLQVGRAFIDAVERLSRVLGNALVGHEAMGGAASALAAASANAWAKYDAAAGAVYSADAATMSVVLRKLQLTAAVESWKQFAAFFADSQL